MHDPLIMAFRIRLPRLKPRKNAWSRSSRWMWTLATVWHRDPSGYDSTTCKMGDLWKHPHHWRLQVDVWQSFRHRWLDRCAWCGEGATKRDLVNLSKQWDPPRRPWWRHTDCFHMECSSIHEAHAACICADGIYDQELSGWGYGNCAKCGKRREWRSDDRRNSPIDEARRILASIPEGKRDSTKYEQVKALWTDHQESKESAA